MCTICLEGHVLDIATKKCEKKESKIDNCKSANFHEGKMHCLWCKVGFITQLDGTCLRMTEPQCRLKDQSICQMCNYEDGFYSKDVDSKGG